MIDDVTKECHNEDCVAARPELGLWVVADETGGHAAGATAIIVEITRTIAPLVAQGVLG